jgi:folate-binding protein YgfZ
MHHDHLAAAAAQGALRLADWGLIRARGADAATFLHGQLTQDIAHLQPGQVRLAGYCSAKGRLLASFVAWAEDGPEAQPAGRDILLACSADVLPATLKRLRLFVLRAKCTLDDVTAGRPLWGLAGPAAGHALGPAAEAPAGQALPLAGGTLLRLHDAVLPAPPAAGAAPAVPRWIWAAPTADAGPPWAGLPMLPGPAWQALEVLAGVPRIVGATVEQFVPQMVNLELVGGVNFQKGCYPGQEVVARSQYRGTLKRRGQVLQASVPMAPGQEVFHSADPGQPAGMVALAGTLGGTAGDGAGRDGAAALHVALAELKLAALGDGTLHLGSADGPPLALGALPYAIPAEPG